jgi:RNA polymerase sigma-70 factor (ECF subfamily)
MEETNTQLTDEQVALLVQQGDKEKFSILMERYEQKLFRYGRKFLSRKENIEDALQEVFMNTYKNIQSFDTSLKFSSWIYRIAHNTYINSLKKNQHSPLTLFDFDTLLSRESAPDQILPAWERRELSTMIDQGLDQLGVKYKEVIILHYLEELSYKEISDVLQIPIGTVGIRIKRAKDALRKIYQSLQLDHDH